ncbi:RraA-like protein [Macroventuria anomochaeta]|uniref:RraA-like protein n=1 Tax=Macroventuria anomochaeta TaxID=301207 RepID=A0ACB6S6U0_9PLEO|nr:RraA-like protein [Macroventuria anomochaeta]KAF2629846.1 RraA-like protein [Macroventuria anomochaeta]
MASSAITQRLKQWTSCDIADGLVKLSQPHGGFLDGLTMYSPQYQSEGIKIVGPAYTVKFVPKADTNAPKPKGNYIDSIPKDAVVFISQPQPHINAVYGGLMSLRAQHLGAAGVIIDGKVRDLQEHRNLNFPLFAKGVGTTAGGPVCRPSEVDVPVKLNSDAYEAWVNPGDYIIADIDGVVCLPKELAEDVLGVVESIVRADEKCAEGIREGRSVEDVFKEFRKP